MRTLKLTLFLTAFFLVMTGLEAHGYNKASSGTDGLNFVSNNAVFTDQKVPVSMDKEHAYTVSYTIKNTGDNTWKTGDYKLKVTITPSDVSKDSRWLVPNIALPNDVLPGSEVTLSFQVTAWNEDGTYSFQAQMMQKEITFGQPSVSVAVDLH